MSTLSGDVYVSGTLTAKRFNPPTGSVTNAAVQAAAGIAATKCERMWSKQLPLTNHATAIGAGRWLLHYVSGASGEVVEFGVLASVAAVGDSTVTVDLYKDGASVLTGTFQVDSGDAAGTLVSGTLSSATLTQGDRLEVVITVSAGTGALPKGFATHLKIKEDPQ